MQQSMEVCAKLHQQMIYAIWHLIFNWDPPSHQSTASVSGVLVRAGMNSVSRSASGAHHYLKRLWLRPRLCHAFDRILSHFNVPRYSYHTSTQTSWHLVLEIAVEVQWIWAERGTSSTSLFALFEPAKCVLRIIPLPYSTTILFSVSKAHWSLTYLGRSMVSWSSVVPGPMWGCYNLALR